MCKQKYNAELEAIISEATKFVNAFGYPISQSMPHIYLSALPFSPSESTVLQHMHNAFQNTLSVQAGSPKQWPVIRQTLTGHSDDVRSVVFSPNSTRIASGSFDNTVRIWDAMSGAPIGEPLKGHSQSVWSVAYSPDGTRIASGSEDNTVRIWDAMSGAPIGEPLKEHSGSYSPDGTPIITSADKMIQLFPAVEAA